METHSQCERNKNKLRLPFHSGNGEISVKGKHVHSSDVREGFAPHEYMEACVAWNIKAKSQLKLISMPTFVTGHVL